MSFCIAVDAMGGDNAPHEIIRGAIKTLNNEHIKLFLLGRETEIKKELTKYEYPLNQLEIIDATDVISNDESPTSAIRRKKNSSIVLGLNLLKDKKAEAFVSAGATGAILTGATVIVGRINGIDRPALGTLLPNEKGFSFLIDCGANVDAKPNYLLQFAKMGSIYMENVLGVENPRVGLLNIGVESEKGNALTKETYELLKNSELNFIGNIEGRDVPSNVADVVVCDAFVGNVILKYTEGFAQSMFNIIKTEVLPSTFFQGADLIANSLQQIKKKFSYSEIGGAPFLGLKALVIKAHGSSDARAIESAIRSCCAFIEKNIVSKIAAN